MTLILDICTQDLHNWNLKGPMGLGDIYTCVIKAWQDIKDEKGIADDFS